MERSRRRNDLHAGRTPRAGGDGLHVRDLLNRFLNAKEHVRESGELSPRSFNDYHRTCTVSRDAFGLTRLISDPASDDFEQFRATLAKTRAPVALGNEIVRVCVADARELPFKDESAATVAGRFARRG